MAPRDSSGIPKVVNDLIRIFDRMPGIGPKTAARLAFYWLRVQKSDVDDFVDTLEAVKSQVKHCKQCFNLSSEELCVICKDKSRDENVICVVEDALDLLSIERADKFRGKYHVLEGVISPVNNVGPEDLTINDLLERVKKLGCDVEVIIATNPTMEGEATAMYIRDMFKKMDNVRVSRLAQGLPSGADIEYADQITISRALEQRSKYE